MKRKTLLYATLAGILLLVIILTIVFKGGKKEIVKIDPEFGKYISAYTSGIISKQSSIKIQLTPDVTGNIKDKSNFPEDLFEFEPEIKGAVYWADDFTLEFKPDDDMPSNTFYKATFNLGKLVDVDDKFSEFVFNFQTIKQNFQITVLEQKTVDRTELKWQKVIGMLQTADVETLDNIQKLISGVYNKADVNIHFSSTQNVKQFLFEVDSLQRFSEAKDLILKWDGSKINVDNSGEMNVSIPALGDFRFLFSRVIQQPEQYLQLQFADPILENQMLDGLVVMQNVDNYKFIVEDNLIKVYPSETLKGTYSIGIESGVQNVKGQKLETSLNFSVNFEDIKPEVRFVKSGTILPSTENGMVLPFEAVNLSAVDVKITKIYSNNIKQFLQVNNLDGSYDLQRVGKAVIDKTVRLDMTDVIDFGKWNRFTLDMNELIKTEPGAIYRVTLSFKKDYSLYECQNDSTTASNDNMQTIESGAEEEGEYGEYYDNYYYDDYYYYDENYWQHRENPCYEAYYGSFRSVSQNILASDIGIIAKKGNDKSLNIFLTDIKTTKPISDATVELYDYQQQLLKTLNTNSEGLATLDDATDVYFIIAKHNNQFGYMKIQDGYSLSVSNFDVSGVAVNKGLKGFLYGERGVWRPGDSLFLTFILEENTDIPEKHPIIFELKNPQYQVVRKIVNNKNQTGFYTFKLKTSEDAPTGYWTAEVSVGGSKFSKSIRIETIKPNRLKMKLDFGREFLSVNDFRPGLFTAQWLHGAPAKDLKAQIDVVMKKVNLNFDKYKDYNFTNPASKFNPEESTLFEGKLDETGTTEIIPEFELEDDVPGKLNITFVTRVFENGGNFSIDQFSYPYYPYSSFLGIKLPKGHGWGGALSTDSTNTIDFIVLDKDGKTITESHLIEVELFKTDYNWWWDSYDGDYGNYNNSYYEKPIKSDKIFTKDGKAKWSFKVDYADYGSYVILAHDKVSGHTTGKYTYISTPGWTGNDNSNNKGATMLSFTAEKDSYNVGETVNFTIPTGKNGRALIAIENGSKVLDKFWVDTEEGNTKVNFKVTEEMTPNIYVHVSVLQPHAQTFNDLPIRMYGILPLTVINPETHIEPVINMPDVLRSESKVDIKISEKNGKPMTYTIAMVDDGLLDLTHFQTPQPWDYFYAKEALGVKTWDIFDLVIGAFGGKIERLLSIGGGDEGEGNGSRKANRFKPMVKFMGPFELKSGKTATHSIQLPQYIGSVRTMVVAGKNRAYGSAEKTTPVRKPLMVLATLPRVLGPGETVKLPVSVFAMEKNIKNVTVQVKTNDLIRIEGNQSKNIVVKEIGEQLAEFDISVLNQTGIAKLEVTATSGSEVSKYNIEIDIRNPNTKVTDIYSGIIEAGQSWDLNFTLPGLPKTNKATLEVSAMPPISLEKRLKYLIAYPHGCVEQTTSSVFPQIYLDNLVSLSTEQKNDIDRNVKAGIERLQKFQQSNGGFSYWPGSGNCDYWATSYVGHFLVEAEKRGYSVPESMLKNWKKYQKSRANDWNDDGPYSQSIQAYRLYTLALAGDADLGAMNRLKEKVKINQLTRWMVALTYCIAGKNNIAEKILDKAPVYVSPYTDMYYTYGSALRDESIILETLALLDRKNEAFSLLKEMSEKISNNSWYSTQTTAFTLVSISKFVKTNIKADDLKFTWTLNNSKTENVNSIKPIAQINIPVNFTDEASLNVSNKSKGVLFTRLVTEGIPAVGETTDSENDLRMEVRYYTLDNQTLNPEKIIQGTDFIAEVKIIHPGIRDPYYQMALTQIFPSGWEIINSRMIETGDRVQASYPTYQDIRDDRVYTYFNLYKYNSNVYRVMLNASYVGRFYLPSVLSEAMYDNTIYAREHGMWVEVIKPE